MAIYRFDRFELSTEPYRLQSRGRAIELRAQALRLLALLVAERGHVVSHDAIRTAIWGERVVDTAKAIPLLIRDIRQALGESAGDPKLIETLPRKGYRFVGAVKPSSSRHASIVAACGLGLAAMACIVLFWLPGEPSLLSEADATYRKGEHLLRSGDADRLAKAEAYFAAALRSDPEHRLALAGLADVAMQRADYARAERYADAAGGEPRADLVRAMISASRDWNWDAAFVHVRRALARDPEMVEAWATKAMLHTIRGETAAALAASDHAYRLDPVSALIRIDHGWFHYYGREFAAALRLCGEALHLEPGSFPAAYCTLKSAMAIGDDREAMRAAERIHAAWSGQQNESPRFSALSDFRLWHRNRLEASVEAGAPLWEALAAVEIQAGRKDAAVGLLLEAADRKSSSLPLALRDPVFDSLVRDGALAGIARAARVPLGVPAET